MTAELEKENIKGVFCWGVKMEDVIKSKDSHPKPENTQDTTKAEKKKIGLKALGKQLIQAVRF